eukprot:5420408-Lingulodinium_polyedra.AAC.1
MLTSPPIISSPAGGRYPARSASTSCWWSGGRYKDRYVARVPMADSICASTAQPGTTVRCASIRS